MPEIRSFHDEPFVIDNCPLGIDIGEKHAAAGKLEKSGDNWIRHHTQLDHLLILNKGETKTDYRCSKYAFNLKIGVKILLEEIDELVTLSFKVPSKPEDGDMTISPSKLKLKRDGKRHLTKDGGEGPKITSVHIAAPDTDVVIPIPIEPGSVFIILYRENPSRA
jgi:hypothetical protein